MADFYKTHIVFIVEDDPVYIKAIKNSLDTRKFVETHVFPVGELCLQKLHLNPAIIILDHNLDSQYHDALNGLDLLKKIKTLVPNTYVIMLSGQDDLEIAVSCILIGAFDYIVKNRSAFVRVNFAVNKIINADARKNELRLYKILTFILFVLSVLLIVSIFFL